MALKYHSMMKKLALTASLLGMSVIAHADYFGAASGRSANPANTPGVSVEGFASLGSDFRVIGARTNFNVNEKLTVYGDIGITEVFLSDGLSFGGGVFYGLESIGREGSFVASLDVAIQGSLHIASLDFFGVDLDYSSFGVAALVSPKTPINDSGLNWYANAGLTRVSRDTGFFGRTLSSIEPQVGGGIHMPAGPGVFYAGGDIIDQVIASAGYRFSF